MRTQTRWCWRRMLPAAATLALFIGACGAAFAQEKQGGGEDTAQDEQYPMPDFSPMNRWYEIRKAEYDLYASPPSLNLLIVIKKESRPYNFDMRFEDEDGTLVKINTGFCAYYLQPGAELNTPIKCNIWVADRQEMKRVKKVRVVQKD